MFKRISAIAINTFREAIRNKVLYILLAFALVMIAFSIVLSALSIGSEEKIIKDVGLSAITIFGILISILVGIGLIYNELDRRTIYIIVSKPIRRYEFVIGKYLGLLLTIATNIAIMSGGFFLLLLIKRLSISFSLVGAILLTFLEIAVVTAIATLFSSFSTPVLSAVFTFLIFVAGHLTDDLLKFAELVSKKEVAYAKILATLSRIVSYILPDLETFNIRNHVVSGVPVAWDLRISVIYGILYIGCVLILSAIIFSYRNFK